MTIFNWLALGASGGGGGGGDGAAPTISSLNPADNATSVAVGANLVATFNEAVQFGASVSIGLYLADDTPVESWDQGDIGSGISISGSVLTINPTSLMAQGQEHYVTITSGSVEDLAGNDFLGLVEGAWSFTTFTPASMFAGGKAGVFYDTSILSSLFSDRSATPVTPAVVDGPVGTRKDLSGNNNHQIAPSDAARPTLRTAGGLYWLEYDGTDDRLVSGSIAALGTTGALFFGAGFSSAASSIALSDDGAGARFIGALTSGSGSAASDVTVGSYNVDGANVAATRAALFTAAASASGTTPHLLEARTATVSLFATSSVGFYSTFAGLVRDYGIVMITESDLGSNQAALRTWFGQKMGIVL